MKRLLLGLCAAFALVAMPATVSAHNAGHLYLPGGACLDIGSFKEAPILGTGVQLDLVPQTPDPPFDEIGVSFVGYYGRTPIHPGGCPA
jgi:hypothetical protein